MGQNISVIGAGSWGTALGTLLAKNDNNVYLWDRNKMVLDEIKSNKENSKYLPDIRLPENIIPTDDLEKCIKKSDIIVLAVASHAIREICKKIHPFIDDKQIIVNVAKGIENKTLLRMSEVISKELPNNEVITLSGPSHAEEVSKDIPTTVVVAGKDQQKTEYIQDLFMSPSFRVYTNPDIIGVELGGALKNVIALAAGVCDGIGYGDNAKAALITRGIVEIGRLGEAMGANPLTFAGLSGIGDLIVTCTSMHSRNRRAGIKLGQGKTLDEVLEEIGMVVEGVRATYSAYHLSQKLDVEMPITTELYNILYNNSNIKDAVDRLMLRSKTSEIAEMGFEDYKKE